MPKTEPLSRRQARKLIRERDRIYHETVHHIPAASLRVQVHQMRLEGFTVNQIAWRLKAPRDEVERALRQVFNDGFRPDKGIERAVQSEQIDAMYVELGRFTVPASQPEGAPEDDNSEITPDHQLRAYDLKIKLLARKARLHGLDEDTTIEVKGFRPQTTTYDDLCVSVVGGKTMGFDDEDSGEDENQA